MRAVVGFLILIAGLAVCSPGCTQHRPPPVVPFAPATQPTVERVSLEPYLRATRVGDWTYERRDLDHPGVKPHHYRRKSTETRRIEGMLVGRDFAPLQDYFMPADASLTELKDPGRMRPPLKGGTAFMFALDEPLPPIPAELVPGEPITATTPVVYYEYDGRYIMRGTLTRRAQIEGVEEVETPAGRFGDCLRVRIDLTLQLPWIVSMEWTSYLWLSAEMGEVRRFEQMSGFFLIFWFSSEHDYLLVSGRPSPTTTQTASSAAGMPATADVLDPRWQNGAVVLDRTVPHPQIAGMIVDLAPTSAPANDDDANGEAAASGDVSLSLEQLGRMLPMLSDWRARAKTLLQRSDAGSAVTPVP